MTISATKPDWLRTKLPSVLSDSQFIKDIKSRSLCTVCVEAQCPNQLECFSHGTATFMLLGPTCTRRCTFCAVGKTTVKPLDPNEPTRIAQTVSQMSLNYCVLTMVTRDDLPDGGAARICTTVESIRDLVPDIELELLISDLNGNWDGIDMVLDVQPEVLSHNIETVPRLYHRVRPQANYSRSLKLLTRAACHHPSIVAKSSIMVGLGETKTELLKTMDDLGEAGCQLLTIGQYLAPSKQHHPVRRYVTPAEFSEYEVEALKRGISGIASAPLVRSSFQAKELYRLASR
jgi:lipoyl synthase